LSVHLLDLLELLSELPVELHLVYITELANGDDGFYACRHESTSLLV
jgi:hypothetical protein